MTITHIPMQEKKSHSRFCARLVNQINKFCDKLKERLDFASPIISYAYQIYTFRRVNIWKKKTKCPAQNSYTNQCTFLKINFIYILSPLWLWFFSFVNCCTLIPCKRGGGGEVGLSCSLLSILGKLSVRYPPLRTIPTNYSFSLRYSLKRETGRRENVKVSCKTLYLLC